MEVEATAFNFRKDLLYEEISFQLSTPTRTKHTFFELVLNTLRMPFSCPRCRCKNCVEGLILSNTKSYFLCENQYCKWDCDLCRGGSRHQNGMHWFRLPNGCPVCQSSARDPEQRMKRSVCEDCNDCAKDWRIKGGKIGTVVATVVFLVNGVGIVLSLGGGALIGLGYYGLSWWCRSSTERRINGNNSAAVSLARQMNTKLIS